MSSTNDGESSPAWLADFHAGRRATLEAVYRDHFATVRQAVGRVLAGDDQETVIHEVFFRLLSSEELRRSYRGGSLGAWLTTVARNQAVDHVRRYRRERSGHHPSAADAGAGGATEQLEARLVVERFRARLPPEWVPVFEARFLLQLNQREAAAALGMHRTTLAYRELRIRALLHRFVLEGDTK
jgi:RNA polymerase sigma-70 factor (ECF subfamily)